MIKGHKGVYLIKKIITFTNVLFNYIIIKWNVPNVMILLQIIMAYTETWLGWCFVVMQKVFVAIIVIMVNIVNYFVNLLYPVSHGSLQVYCTFKIPVYKRIFSFTLITKVCIRKYVFPVLKKSTVQRPNWGFNICLSWFRKLSFRKSI